MPRRNEKRYTYHSNKQKFNMMKEEYWHQSTAPAQFLKTPLTTSTSSSTRSRLTKHLNSASAMPMLPANSSGNKSIATGSHRINVMSTVGNDKPTAKQVAWESSSSSTASSTPSLVASLSISTSGQEKSSSFKIGHNYHDYAQTTYDEYKALHPSLKKPRDQTYQLPFPKLVHAMLDAVGRLDQEHIVSWCPHGRAFQIHDRQAFSEQVLPYQNFTQSKYASFQRQLNLYGFKRLTSGADEGAYYHELFLRGRIDLTDAMHRIRLKGAGRKGGTKPEEEPNLYAYPPLFCRPTSLAKPSLAISPSTSASSLGNKNMEDLACVSLSSSRRVSESSVETDEMAAYSSNNALLIMEQALALTSTSTSEQGDHSNSPTTKPTYEASAGIASTRPRNSMYESDDEEDEHIDFANESFSNFAW